MNDNMPNLSGFPTDNLSSTNVKYDIIASKFITGIENHHKRNVPSLSVGIVFDLLVGVVHLAVALILFLLVGLRWVYKKN
jgi:hypothetical protein